MASPGQGGWPGVDYRVSYSPLGTSTDPWNRMSEIDELKKEFPEFSIVHSTGDRWWAFSGHLPPSRRPAPHTVEADTPDQLRATLRQAVRAR
jgi:hypothetical protein